MELWDYTDWEFYRLFEQEERPGPMVELRPHQKEVLDKLDNGKILCGGTGSGKSITAAAYYIKKEAPKDVYVITTAKKRDDLDWNKEFMHFGVGRTSDTTFHGVLTVDSWNNIRKYEDVESAFFIFDEQRLVGSGAWTKSFDKIAEKNNWILLSATPGDTWLDYIPVFVANGFYKNRTQFKQEHVVYNHHAKFPKVDRYIGTGKLVRLRNELLVDMPYEMHTTRHLHTIKVDYDEDLFKKVWKDRWHVYENRPLRDVAELFSVMRKAVNSDSTRLDALQSIMIHHPKVIVFYNFDYELEILRGLFTADSSLRSERSSEKNSTLSHESETSRPSSGRLSGTSTRSPSYANTSRGSTLRRTDTSTTDTVLGGSTPLTVPYAKRNGHKHEPIPTSPSERLSRSEKTMTDSGSRPDSTSPGSFAIAEWNGHKHEPIPTSDRWVYLVQYTAGSEGWNCIDTDTVVFFSLTYSWKQFHQAHGRIDRMNTPFTDLHYYVFKSDSLIDRAVWTALLKKKSFNESALGIKFD